MSNDITVRDGKFPVSPMEKVAIVVLDHLKQVFDHNFKNGNFYLDPQTEMYIRTDYPEKDNDVGFKPGFVLKSAGGLTNEPAGLGMQANIPQDWRMTGSIEGYDVVHHGTLVLRAIAEVDVEAARLAFLGEMSINHFRQFLMGREGIADIHCQGFGDSYPYEAGGYHDAFACDLQVRYAKREAYAVLKDAPTLEGFSGKTITY